MSDIDAARERAFAIIKDISRQRAQSRLEGVSPPSMYEAEVHRLDGTVVPVEFYLSVIEFNGKPAILNGIRDITERKKAKRVPNERRISRFQIDSRGPRAGCTRGRTACDIEDRRKACLFQGCIGGTATS